MPERSHWQALAARTSPAPLATPRRSLSEPHFAAPNEPPDLDDGVDEPPGPPQIANGGFDANFTAGGTALALGGVTFRGSGVPVGGYARKTFVAHGDAVGLHVPWFWETDFAAHYSRRFFEVGLMAGWGSTTRGAREPPMDPALALTFAGNELLMLTLAGDFSIAVPRGPVTVRAGTLVGVRYLTAKLGAPFQQEPCTRHSSCGPSASATIPLIQPRVTVDYSFSSADSTAALGAFLGVDTDPGLGVSLGVSVSLRRPFARLAP